MSESANATEPYNVRCKDCSHVWVGFYLPQTIAVVAAIAGKLCCPKCGALATRIVMWEGEKP